MNAVSRKKLRAEMGNHLYAHLLKEVPFIRGRLSNAELNEIVHSVAGWFCDAKIDPLTLARVVIRSQQEDDRPVLEKAIPDSDFQNELDKI